jgi:type II secretory pathway predicted ATPase ExeA
MGGCQDFLACATFQAVGVNLVLEAFKIHHAGKMLVPIIDDAHLMPTECLRKLRLLCEDFPHSHNLVLIGQPPLLQSLALSINEEIRSRVTYSVVHPGRNTCCRASPSSSLRSCTRTKDKLLSAQAKSR